jgi:hypothetical protein
MTQTITPSAAGTSRIGLKVVSSTAPQSAKTVTKQVTQAKIKTTAKAYTVTQYNTKTVSGTKTKYAGVSTVTARDTNLVTHYKTVTVANKNAKTVTVAGKARSVTVKEDDVKTAKTITVYGKGRRIITIWQDSGKTIVHYETLTVSEDRIRHKTRTNSLTKLPRTSSVKIKRSVD